MYFYFLWWFVFLFRNSLQVFFMRFGNKAQVSVELIIVFAALVAIVLLLVSQLSKTTEKGTKIIEGKSSDIFKEIEKID